MDYGLKTTDYRLWTKDYGLQSTYGPGIREQVTRGQVLGIGTRLSKMNTLDSSVLCGHHLYVHLCVCLFVRPSIRPKFEFCSCILFVPPVHVFVCPPVFAFLVIPPPCSCAPFCVCPPLFVHFVQPPIMINKTSFSPPRVKSLHSRARWGLWCPPGATVL